MQQLLCSAPLSLLLLFISLATSRLSIFSHGPFSLSQRRLKKRRRPR
jgi:hypothetical protein